MSGLGPLPYGLAPCSNKVVTISVCPYAVAWINGVLILSGKLTLAPSSISKSTISFLCLELRMSKALVSGVYVSPFKLILAFDWIKNLIMSRF